MWVVFEIPAGGLLCPQETSWGNYVPVSSLRKKGGSWGGKKAKDGAVISPLPACNDEKREVHNMRQKKHNAKGSITDKLIGTLDR